jgi:tRNA1Val (adenine37-N6)-methyltransferase
LIEIDEAAAEQAVKNTMASPWGGRIRVTQADVKKFAFAQKYEVIISNPPFYENELRSDDPKKNTAHHDGGLLLPGLLTIIRENLAADGFFFLLLPYKRYAEIPRLFAQHKLAIEDLVLVRQSISHDYFRILLHGKLISDKQGDTAVSEISIKDENGQYTASFTSLLKDYYLHL